MNKKVLIVDDDTYMCELIERALEPLEDVGVELTITESGKEALEIVHNNQPQLLILDLAMPEMNGIEVCESLQNLEWSPYIIMLTAHGQEIDRIRAENAGVDEFHTKPFDPDILLKRAAQLLEVEIDL